MNRFVIFLMIKFVVFNSLSQDTIINYSNRVVKITDSLRKYTISYKFKQDYKIRDGLFQYDFYSNGVNFTTRQHYKDGLKHGLLISYSDGNLDFVQKWKNGVPHGKIREFANNKLILSGHYHRGIKKGRWKYVNQEGINSTEIVEKGRYSGKVIFLQIEQDTLFTITTENNVTLNLGYFRDRSIIDYLRNMYDVNLVKNGEEFLKIGTWKYLQNQKLISKKRFCTCGIMITSKDVR